MKPVRPELEVVTQGSDERCRQIAADIDEVGQLVPILLYEGAVIDGRTRDKAIEKYCKPGIVPIYEEYDGDLPAYRLAYSLNLRRDLTKSQRAMLVLESWDEYKADARKRMVSGVPLGTGAQGSRATEDAAEDAGVSDRTMHDAVVVKEQGSKRLQRQVRDGKVSAKAAAKEVRNRKAEPKEKPDYGKCPCCAKTKWTEDETGVFCAKCHHPHGEPTGGPDDDSVKTQMQLTVKTIEALMRAFDDLHLLLPRTTEHKASIASCKELLKTAKGWR